jgi:hypothetical protein
MPLTMQMVKFFLMQSLEEGEANQKVRTQGQATTMVMLAFPFLIVCPPGLPEGLARQRYLNEHIGPYTTC